MRLASDWDEEDYCTLCGDECALPIPTPEDIAFGRVNVFPDSGVLLRNYLTTFNSLQNYDTS